MDRVLVDRVLGDRVFWLRPLVGLVWRIGF